MWIFRRINTLWQNVLNICHYDTCASESRPERVRLCVHTTELTGPVPEPFHCDHIARWSARSGTTGRSGTGVNTGARLRSGTVPVPKLWCEHGLSLGFVERRLQKKYCRIHHAVVFAILEAITKMAAISKVIRLFQKSITFDFESTSMLCGA